MASTRKGCLGMPPQTKLVTGQAMMIPYNSRVPVVVYASPEAEIRYRIYEGGALLPD